MDKTVGLNSVNLINDDSLRYIKILPDNCIDLIATDPPYFQVKNCAWDNQWTDVSAYLSWLDDMMAEFWRVLKPNGSLYLFCGSRLAADTELLLRERILFSEHYREPVKGKCSEYHHKKYSPSNRQTDVITLVRI